MLTLPDAIVSLLVSLRNAVYKPNLAESPTAAGRRDPDPGPTHRGGGVRVMGRSDQRDYARYHEVLNRAVWSSRQAARIPGAVAPAPGWWRRPNLIFGIDEPLERRRGDAKIRARAIYRTRAFQPVSGGQGQRPALDLPDVAGPRALGRTPLGLAGAHGAGAFDPLLPTAGTPAQKLTTGPARWSCNLRAGCHRPLVLVGDNSYAVLDLLHCCQSLREPVTLIARLRLDAALYAPAPPRQPGQNGRPPLKGPRRPPLKVFLEQTD